MLRWTGGSKARAGFRQGTIPNPNNTSHQSNRNKHDSKRKKQNSVHRDTYAEIPPSVVAPPVPISHDQHSQRLSERRGHMPPDEAHSDRCNSESGPTLHSHLKLLAEPLSSLNSSGVESHHHKRRETPSSSSTSNRSGRGVDCMALNWSLKATALPTTSTAMTTTTSGTWQQREMPGFSESGTIETSQLPPPMTRPLGIFTHSVTQRPFGVTDNVFTDSGEEAFSNHSSIYVERTVPLSGDTETAMKLFPDRCTMPLNTERWMGPSPTPPFLVVAAEEDRVGGPCDAGLRTSHKRSVWQSMSFTGDYQQQQQQTEETEEGKGGVFSSQRIWNESEMNPFSQHTYHQPSIASYSPTPGPRDPHGWSDESLTNIAGGEGFSPFFGEHYALSLMGSGTSYATSAAEGVFTGGGNANNNNANDTNNNRICWLPGSSGTYGGISGQAYHIPTQDSSLPHTPSMMCYSGEERTPSQPITALGVTASSLFPDYFGSIGAYIPPRDAFNQQMSTYTRVWPAGGGVSTSHLQHTTRHLHEHRGDVQGMDNNTQQPITTAATTLAEAAARALFTGGLRGGEMLNLPAEITSARYQAFQRRHRKG